MPAEIEYYDVTDEPCDACGGFHPCPCDDFFEREADAQAPEETE